MKDLFDTAGIRTTYGSAVFGDYTPPATAPAVRMLETAGWVNVGKANLHEFAYGVTSQNLHYGVVPNPAAPGRTAGGSSGGSAAALVAGLADGALGTDTGGSIRIPAACCGIVGFKPTYGLVPTEGVFPLAPTFDCAGPMALDVPTCASLLQTLVPELETVELQSLEEVSAGLAWVDDCEPLVREGVLAAAATFPRCRRVDAPTAEPVGTVFMREVADVHHELYAEYADLYGDNIREKIERCLAVDDAAYSAAARARTEHSERVEDAMSGCDLLLAPTLAFAPPPADVDEVAIRGRMTRFTFPFNSLGWPVLAVPCGRGEGGLPVSLQIAGRKGADALVLAVGALLERALKA